MFMIIIDGGGVGEKKKKHNPLIPISTHTPFMVF